MSSRSIRGPFRFDSVLEYTGTSTIVVGNESIIMVNKTSGAATAVTLPAPGVAGSRRVVIIVDKKKDAATNNITVTPASGTINGSATHVISENGGAQMYLDNGSEWETLLPPGVSATEIGYINGVAPGTQAASKAIVNDANANQGAIKATSAAFGTSGSEIPFTPIASEITGTTAVTAAQSGMTFYINNATGFVTTLPAPALGLRYTFINKTANTSGNHTIVTNASANIIKGNQNSVAGDAGDTGTGDDTINFVANNSLAGDKVELRSDGTSWFAYAISRVAAGMTFTTAS